MVLLCNRNQELRHTGYLQQLIIFPLIIARCAEETLRVLLFRLGVTQGAPPLNAHSFGASLSTASSLSETELRAAQPNLHSGRLRLLLQVAARYLSAEQRRKFK